MKICLDIEDLLVTRLITDASKKERERYIILTERAKERKLLARWMV